MWGLQTFTNLQILPNTYLPAVHALSAVNSDEKSTGLRRDTPIEPGHPNGTSILPSTKVQRYLLSSRINTFFVYNSISAYK